MNTVIQKQKNVIQSLLDLADVRLNGERPWDIHVKDDRTYARFLSGGTLGFGESYMDDWWDTEQLDELVARVLKANLHMKVRKNPKLLLYLGKAIVTNAGSAKRAYDIGEKHYDIGNDLYERMLDPRMVYTCGYWKDAHTLLEAQEAKLDLVCRKIGLQRGDHVLDIGCGWGSFARYAAEKYGARVTGITVSKEQVELAKKRCEGLPVEIRLQDYRDVKETFDHVISLGMFEHVGYKNYRTYMKVVKRVLKPDGLFLLHTIGGNTSSKTTDPWIDAYIFPGSMLPSAKQITTAYEGLFVLEDWHGFGADYDKTLLEWFKNFDSHWSEIQRAYGERFYRMWKFYLLSCAGSFRCRYNQLWQLVLSPHGVKGGYTSLR